ncbi:ParB/RepB/Spo0J family partition protein [Streptosporangium sp. NPDC002721]|uniref:ParB/RepB/Spo0J family partition protein n=1 Tax=Streptosporangium sp. NPDC002721 TaxID=3366188 RepID=UPI0036BED0A9
MAAKTTADPSALHEGATPPNPPAPVDAVARTSDTTAKNIVAKTVPVDRIDRDPDQPRKHFDEAELNKLAQSMKELGQLQPISVRYIPDTRRYTIVMGERRWRAAQIAGLAEMHCLVMHGVKDGDPGAFARAVAENVGRVDMTPLEEAAAFQRLVDNHYGIEQVAAMCGKSPAYISARIDLLNLVVPVREALAEGHIPLGLASYLTHLRGDNQTRLLARWTRGDFATVRDAEVLAQTCRTEEERQAAHGGVFVLAEEAHVPARVIGAGEPDGLFGEPDKPVAEGERIAVARHALLNKIEWLGGAGAILAEVAAMDPGELAVLLAAAPGGIAAQRKHIDHLKEVTVKAIATLRTAQALAAVNAGALHAAPQAEPIQDDSASTAA